MRRQLFTVVILSVSFVFLLSACTSLKRFAYQGYKRDEWQQPNKVVASLHLKAGEQVADLGAGGGYFTFRLADAVGENGTVYAVDIDKGLLEYVEKSAREKGYHNIKIIQASEDDAGLPPDSVDLIFVADTYHHLSKRVDYFRRIKAALKDQGRVAIIDFTSGWLKSIGHGTPTQVIMDEMRQAGYRLQTQFDFLEKQNFLIFRAVQ